MIQRYPKEWIERTGRRLAREMGYVYTKTKTGKDNHMVGFYGKTEATKTADEELWTVAGTCYSMICEGNMTRVEQTAGAKARISSTLLLTTPL